MITAQHRDWRFCWHSFGISLNTWRYLSQESNCAELCQQRNIKAPPGSNLYVQAGGITFWRQIPPRRQRGARVFAGREPCPAPARTAAQPAVSSCNETSLPATMSSEKKTNTPRCISYAFLTAVNTVSQPTKGLHRAAHASARLSQTRRRNVPRNRSSELFPRCPRRSTTLHNHESWCCQPRNAFCHILQSGNWIEIKSAHRSYARQLQQSHEQKWCRPSSSSASCFKSVPCTCICKFLPLSRPKFPLLPFPRTLKLFIITLF